MSYALSEMDRLLSTLIMPGEVAAVDPANGMVRIASDGWTSSWVPWFSMAAGKVRFWRVPDQGEQALLLCPSGEPDNGFAVVGWFTDQFGRDGRSLVVAWKMPDGAVFEYDFEAGQALVDGCKTVTVRAAEAVTIKTTRVLLDAPDVEVLGNLKIAGGLQHLAGDGAPASFGGGVKAAGDIASQMDVKAGGISLAGHHHEEHDGPNTSNAK